MKQQPKRKPKRNKTSYASLDGLLFGNDQIHDKSEDCRGANQNSNHLPCAGANPPKSTLLRGSRAGGHTQRSAEKKPNPKFARHGVASDYRNPHVDRTFAVCAHTGRKATLEEYLEENNKHPKPFVWTATVEQILAKVNRCKAILETLH